MNRALKIVLNGLMVTCFATTAFADFNATPDFTKGNPEKGKVVYQRIGNCVNCHGWPGDGVSGRNPLSHSAGANLRESKLDARGLYDVIRCGLPGTKMPYHDSASYKDDRCFGMLMSDFDVGGAPIKGKTMRDAQMVDLIAYIQKYMVGKGKPTYEDCALYFDTSAEKSCSHLKAN